MTKKPNKTKNSQTKPKHGRKQKIPQHKAKQKPELNPNSNTKPDFFF